MDTQEIRRMLEEGLPQAEVEVAGDGRHFQALIVTPAFEGKGMIQRHRMVYAILQEHIDSEVLHAISMRTLTPEQYRAERD